MPTYRNLTLNLKSQYDILTIPEFAPPSPGLASATALSIPTQSQAWASPFPSTPIPRAKDHYDHGEHGDEPSSTPIPRAKGHYDHGEHGDDPFISPNPATYTRTPTNINRDAHRDHSFRSSLPSSPLLPSPASLSPRPITLIDSSQSLISVYIPRYPLSQFWLCYSISPPHPPGLLYYFKMYLNGECVVSWGVGAEEGWQGKTVFALFEPGGDSTGRVREKGPSVRKGMGGGPRNTEEMEGRVFCFGSETMVENQTNSERDGKERVVSMPEVLEDMMEIRVYRSKGRAKMAPQVTKFKESALTRESSKKSAPGKLKSPGTRGQGDNAGGGIQLVNAGMVPPQHPRSYYRYSLLDPLDRPFATFRYYYRSWQTLEEMGVISPCPSLKSTRESTIFEENKSAVDSNNEGGERKTADSASIQSEASPISGRARSSISVEELSDSSDDYTESDTQAGSPILSKTRRSLQFRPPTPPPHSPKSRQVTFLPTATGLVPTNAQPPHIPAISVASPSLSRQTSRESFTALIRTNLSSPDQSTFRLNEPKISQSPTLSSTSESPTPAERPTRGGIALLKHAISNKIAKQRRRSSLSSGGSEPSIQSEDDGGNPAASGRNGETFVESSNQGQQEGKGETKRGNSKKGKDKENVSESDEPKVKVPARSRSKKGDGRKLHLWEQI